QTQFRAANAQPLVLAASRQPPPLLARSGAQTPSSAISKGLADKGVRAPLVISLLMLLCLGTSSALATVSITAATGGAISADKAANATSPAWTTLGPIVISEANNKV